VDSLIRDTEWASESSKTGVYLHVDQIHLETSEIYSKSATLDSLLQTVSHFPRSKTNCFTVVFTANPANANMHNEKKSFICPSPDATSYSIALVQTVSEGGYELPDSEIIKRLLQSTLQVFGANNSESNCDNRDQLQHNYFSGSLTRLSLRNCTYKQISQKLAEKVHSKCLEPSNIDLCGDSSISKENCDCGYKSLCVSEMRRCCLPIFYRKPFRDCRLGNYESNCHEPTGLCASDSVCIGTSNYANGTLWENYAAPRRGILVEAEDGSLTSSDKTLHRRALLSASMAIFCHLLFYYLLSH